MPFALDRILESAVQRSATEIWFVAGHAPWLRLDGSLRQLDLAPVDVDDVEHLLTYSPAPALAATVARGMADFPIQYGPGHATFDVSVITAGRTRLAVLRLSQPVERPSAS